MARPVRYNMIGLLFCSSVVNYIDRVNISVAAPVIMAATNWDKDRFGLVFSAFLVGYALFQIPGGLVADRWSARKVLAVAFCGFSLFTALTPLGQLGFVLFIAMRFLVGAFESLTFPALTSLNSRWIPRTEFGRAQTISISGVTVGQMIAYPLTTWIVVQFSWPSVFYFNAVLGFVWAAVWLWYATDTPQEHPRISRAERDYIESNLSPKPSDPLPIRTLFRSLPLFTVCLSYMGYAYIGWMFLFWFPTYLVEGREMSLATMGLMGVLLHGAGFLGILAGGAVSDWLLREGWSAQFARARLAGFGVGVSLPFLLGAAVAPSTTLCVLFLIVFYFFFASAVAGYTTVSIEFNPHFAGAIFGMINCLGSFAGIFGPMTAGFMLADGGTWTLPFFVATGVGCVCTAILLVVPIRPIAFAGSAVPEGEGQQAEA